MISLINRIKIAVRSQKNLANGLTDSHVWGVIGMVLAQGFTLNGSIRFSGTGWSGNPVKPEKTFFDKYFLCPKKLLGNDGYHNLNLRYNLVCVTVDIIVNTTYWRNFKLQIQFKFYFWDGCVRKTFWMEEVIDVSGKQNRGARNFVRQPLLDKTLILIMKTLCP